MPKYEKFEDLPVWQEAARLYNKVLDLLEEPVVPLTPGFRNQLDRAALSVSNNVAEGFERVTVKELNSFLGIAPNEHSSGSSVHGHPTSRHFGPTAIRKLLYLAALSVSTHRDQFRSYYLRKTQEEGKPARVVLNNIENKLIKIICAVLRSNSPYHPDYSPLPPLKALTAS